MQRPSLSPDYFPRERLLHDLDAGRELPLVLITGPAGYGKTTLMSAWLETMDWPAVWVSLDKSDNNLRVFVQYVIATIQKRFPESLHKTEALLRSIKLPSKSVLASTLINDLDHIETPFVLALDDYHLIQDPAIHDLVAQILRHPPQSLHLAITSRYDPMLPLSAMRARGSIAEVRIEALRFNTEESASLLQQLAGKSLTTETLLNVTEQLDGWAAGLRVAALSLRHNPNVLSNKPEGMSASSNLMAYLFDEVLMQQQPAIQNFLLRTSILDTLNPDLCDAVVGRENARWNGERCLDYIANSGLFVNRIDDEARAYRYHHLFQKLLREQLRQLCSEAEVIALHSRASDWYAMRGQPDEALRYAFITRDYARAESLVSRFRHELINNDEWQRQEQWISQFPRKVVAASADLLVAEIYIAYIHFRRTECNELIDQAETLISSMSPSTERDALRGEVAAMRAHYYFFDAVDLVKCEANVKLALELIPLERWAARTQSWMFCGGVQIVQGHRPLAYEVSYRGLSEDHAQGDGFQVHLLCRLGFIHAYAGDLSGQMRSANEVLKHDDSTGKADLPSRWVSHLNWARYHIAVAHYYRNELAEAEAQLLIVFKQRYQSHVHCATQSLFILSLIYQAQCQHERAKEMANIAAQYILEMCCTALIPATELFQAQLALQQGELAEAVQLLASRDLPAMLPPTPFFFTPFMTIAKVHLAEGSESSPARVEAMLARLHGYAEQMHNPRILMEVLALEALLADARQDTRTALITLERALVLAQPEGFVRIFADLGAPIAGLLSRLHSRHVSPAFIHRILNAIDQSVRPTLAKISLVEPLTDRELEVLTLLQKRLSNKEIASMLFISPGTVKRHTHMIFQKLDAHSRRDAVHKGIGLKLLAIS